jgi:hypothetical protein
LRATAPLLLVAQGDSAAPLCIRPSSASTSALRTLPHARGRGLAMLVGCVEWSSDVGWPLAGSCQVLKRRRAPLVRKAAAVIAITAA